LYWSARKAEIGMKPEQKKKQELLSNKLNMLLNMRKKSTNPDIYNKIIETTYIELQRNS
jgi:hypothetical protein